MKIKRDGDEEEELVQMAPLIDCVFNLMIFFFVTSMAQKPHKDLGIVLPTASCAEKATAQHDTIIIEVTAGRPPHGEPLICMEGEEMTQTLLHLRLRKLVLKDPERKVRLDVDREAGVYEVARILDLLQFEGLGDVGIRTLD